MAEMMYVLASGGQIDTSKTERFIKQVDAIYQNPFTAAEEDDELTADKIKRRVIAKLKG